MLPKVKTELILFFYVIAPNLHCKNSEKFCILWPPNLQVCKLLISDLKSFLSGKTSRGKYPSNLAEITWSQISTPKKQIHIRSSRAPLKIYFANLEYIFHCCKYNMLQRNFSVHSERKINAGTWYMQKFTSLMADVWSFSSLFLFPQGKLQLASAFHPLTSKHCREECPCCLENFIVISFYFSSFHANQSMETEKSFFEKENSYNQSIN